MQARKIAMRGQHDIVDSSSVTYNACVPPVAIDIGWILRERESGWCEGCARMVEHAIVTVAPARGGGQTAGLYMRSLATALRYWLEPALWALRMEPVGAQVHAVCQHMSPSHPLDIAAAIE